MTLRAQRQVDLAGSVYLVDNVLDTGETLRAAQRALGRPVGAMVLAVTSRPEGSAARDPYAPIRALGYTDSEITRALTAAGQGPRALERGDEPRDREAGEGPEGEISAVHDMLGWYPDIGGGASSDNQYTCGTCSPSGGVGCPAKIRSSAFGRMVGSFVRKPVRPSTISPWIGARVGNFAPSRRGRMTSS